MKKLIAGILISVGLVASSIGVYAQRHRHKTKGTAQPTAALKQLGACSDRGGLPDANCTPGDTDPRVTQANIQRTICVPGYTKKVRPPVSYTGPLKLTLMSKYGFGGSAGNYELDHLISLELGGNPRSVKNLWPEAYNPTPGAHQKDKVENYLRQQVCSGAMTLDEAQRGIAQNWKQYMAAAGVQ